MSKNDMVMGKPEAYQVRLRGPSGEWCPWFDVGKFFFDHFPYEKDGVGEKRVLFTGDAMDAVLADRDAYVQNAIDLRAQAEELKHIAQKNVDRNVDLSAQLAERDALLASVVNSGALSCEQYEELEADCCAAVDVVHQVKRQEFHEHLDKCAALSASAEPSAPVERGGLKECPKGYGHGGQWCGPSYNCWLDRRSDEEKARAALERKP
jgi:hypothetical protein